VGPHDIVVEKADPAGGDRAQREFLETRYAELPDQQDVERHTKGSRHLERDRHPTPRQPQHDDIVASSVVAQQSC